MLNVQALRKTFVPPGRGTGSSDVVAIDGINFEVQEGEMFTLLGPSGCGKTTTLRCIAGLESPDSGRISVGGKDVYNSDAKAFVPANRRQFGMVFQSYAIWPHLTVFENAAFPLRVQPRRGLRAVGRPGNKRELRERVRTALDAVGLGELETRRATDLSGGQQQRLALARAMVMTPRMLLLDEPLSNLDAKLRERMRFELKSIQRSLGVTALYVTHDQSEALSMSDRIAIMRNGEIVQMGRPEDVYLRPNSQFVADFLGNANTVDGVVTERLSSGKYRVATEFGEVIGSCPDELWSPETDAPVVLSIRPESLELRSGAPVAGAATNVFTGKVAGRAYLGDSVEIILMVGSSELRVRQSPRLSFGANGDEVSVHLPEDTCLIIPGKR